MSNVKVIANDIKVGSILDYKNDLYSVLKREHIKPGKGGAYVQVEMKKIAGGDTKLEIRFRSSENVYIAYLDEEEYKFLYSDKESVFLMNLIDCEQSTVSKKLFGGRAIFLQDDIMVKLLKHGDKIVSATLPDNVTLKVMETDPYIKGQTAAASYKSAVLENGLRVMVPPFIKIDDKLIINTNDSTYVERAK